MDNVIDVEVYILQCNRCRININMCGNEITNNNIWGQQQEVAENGSKYQYDIDVDIDWG